MINEGFTLAFFERMCSFASNESKYCEQLKVDITDEIIDASTIHLYSDLSSKLDGTAKAQNIDLIPTTHTISDVQVSITIDNQTLMAYKVQCLAWPYPQATLQQIWK